MLKAASPEIGLEIHRLLSGELVAPPIAKDFQRAELGFLAALLTEIPGAASEFASCERVHYDNVRPENAPSSRRLVERYGSWSRACCAASALSDGSARGRGKSWPTANRGKHCELFTRDEALAAVRRCASELRDVGLVGPPTSWQYDEWVRRTKLEGERRGQRIRLPYAKTLYSRVREHQRGRSRWCAILAEAGLDGDIRR